MNMRNLVIWLWLGISLLSCQEDSVSPSSSLPGQWALIGFANQQGQLIELEPNRQTNPLSITFTTDTIQGDLDINSMSARYRLLNDTTLLVTNLTYTEALGTPREQNLLRNFPRDTARYTLTADTLILFPASRSNQAPDTDDIPTVYERVE